MLTSISPRVDTDSDSMSHARGLTLTWRTAEVVGAQAPWSRLKCLPAACIVRALLAAKGHFCLDLNAAGSHQACRIEQRYMSYLLNISSILLEAPAFRLVASLCAMKTVTWAVAQVDRRSVYVVLITTRFRQITRAKPLKTRKLCRHSRHLAILRYRRSRRSVICGGTRSSRLASEHPKCS